MNIFINNCLETSPSIIVPVLIISDILVSLSNIIRAPILCLDNEYSVSTISSIVFSNFLFSAFSPLLLSKLKFVLPRCSNPALSSGWNIIQTAITPKLSAFFNIQ